MKYLYILALLISTTIGCVSQDYQKLINYNIPIVALVDSLEIPEHELKIIIDKSDYKLTIKHQNQVIKEYPVVFGGNPIDDKLKEGDKCTPEGTFNIISKYPHASWSKFIWINYPTNESWKKHNKAKSEGLISANSNIGGEIGIHGVPDGYDTAIDYKQNWTLGCISLKNKDVNDIYSFITKANDIVIQK